MVFESNDSEINSVADVKSSDSFSLALTDDGENVYSWGRGIMGHLGNGSENTQVTPQKVNFDFRNELKKIKKVKRENGGSTESELEDMLFYKNFLNHASKSKGSKNLQKAQSFIDEKCVSELQNLNSKDQKKFK